MAGARGERGAHCGVHPVSVVDVAVFLPVNKVYFPRQLVLTLALPPPIRHTSKIKTLNPMTRTSCGSFTASFIRTCHASKDARESDAVDGG